MPHNIVFRKAQKAHDPDDCERWEEAEYANTLNGQGDTARVVPLAYALRSDAGRDGKAKTPSPDAEGHVRLRDPGFTVEVERSPTIDANQPHTVVTTIPRRLTPTETERLQSFPDGWTEYGAELNKKGQPFAVRLKDGPRYRMMGNAVTVDVIEWIGRRIPTPTED